MREYSASKLIFAVIYLFISYYISYIYTWHIGGRRELHTWLWWVNLKVKVHLEDLGMDRRIVLKWVVKR